MVSEALVWRPILCARLGFKDFWRQCRNVRAPDNQKTWFFMVLHLKKQPPPPPVSARWMGVRWAGLAGWARARNLVSID